MVLGVKIATQALVNGVNNGLKRNIACSPMSISAMMNLLASGSKGPELSKWLGLLGAKSVVDIDAKSRTLIRAAKPSRKEGLVISFVNGVWVDKKLPLQPHLYQELEPMIHKAKTIYRAVVKNLDFHDKTGESIREINEWFEFKTRGLIENILSENLFPPPDFILANALYFKGFWLNQFNPKMTRHDKFFLVNGQVVRVPFMNKNKLDCYYKSFDDFKVLSLPYKNNKLDDRRFSMRFFLPKRKDGLPNLLQRMRSNPEILYCDQKLRETTIDNLKIPKFEISHEFDVKEVMEKELGLTIPIELNLLRFKVGHKCFIEVNEEGTEAAAVTNALYCTSPRRPPKPKNFIVDRPFVFVLMEESSRVIFFVGAIINPLLN